MASPWTEERVAELIELTAEGYSASQAASVLGVTRNAVIGKLTRLGESRVVSRRRSLSAAPKTQEGRRKNPVTRPKTKPLKQVTHEDLPRPDGATKEPKGCRYPYGDPKDDDWCFCQRPVVGQESWCEGHKAIVFSGTYDYDAWKKNESAKAKRAPQDFYEPRKRSQAL